MFARNNHALEDIITVIEIYHTHIHDINACKSDEFGFQSQSTGKRIIYFIYLNQF